MSVKTKVTIKTVIKPDAPAKFKREVAMLLNVLMHDYNIGHKGDSLSFERSFKDTFKSNLYYLIDNYYRVKKK